MNFGKELKPGSALVYSIKFVNTTTRIALAQMNGQRPPAAALIRASELVAEAAANGARVVCLPELFGSSYFCQHPGNTAARKLAETIPGSLTERLALLARQYRIVLIAGSLFEYEPQTKRYFNTTPVFEADGRLLGVYRKTHIPNERCYHELDYFTPGDTGVQVFATSAGRIAVLLCYDQWYPELARIAALQGAELIVYPTAIGDFLDEVPEEGEWQGKWETVQVAHAITNNVFIAAVNRVGIEDNLAFWGGSFVADSWGTVIARAGHQEQLLYADCDFGSVKRMQELWGFLANRRAEVYHPLSTSCNANLVES